MPVLGIRSRPEWPSPDTTLTPFYGMSSDHDGYIYLPAFSDSPARSSIRMNLQSNNDVITYYDEDGSAITDGVWSSGMTVDEASGSANTEYWCGAFMHTDGFLYTLTMDINTDPDALYLSKTNKSGVTTAIGNAALGNTSMNYSALTWFDNYTGPLYRDSSSGNFVLPFANTSDGNSAAGVPHRGVKITISSSDGSLSYSNLFGSNFGSSYPYKIYGAVGPTSNNIYGGPFTFLSGKSWIGSLANTSTGRGVARAVFQNPSPMYNAASTIKSFRWRGCYVFGSYGEEWGPTIFSESSLHSYIDNMARYYGIL